MSCQKSRAFAQKRFSDYLREVFHWMNSWSLSNSTRNPLFFFPPCYSSFDQAVLLSPKQEHIERARSLLLLHSAGTSTTLQWCPPGTHQSWSLIQNQHQGNKRIQCLQFEKTNQNCQCIMIIKIITCFLGSGGAVVLCLLRSPLHPVLGHGTLTRHFNLTVPLSIQVYKELGWRWGGGKLATSDLKVLRDPWRTWTFNRYLWFYHSSKWFWDANPPNG